MHTTILLFNDSAADDPVDVPDLFQRLAAAAAGPTVEVRAHLDGRITMVQLGQQLAGATLAFVHMHQDPLIGIPPLADDEPAFHTVEEGVARAIWAQQAVGSGSGCALLASDGPPPSDRFAVALRTAMQQLLACPNLPARYPLIDRVELRARTCHLLDLHARDQLSDGERRLLNYDLLTAWLAAQCRAHNGAPPREKYHVFDGCPAGDQIIVVLTSRLGRYEPHARLRLPGGERFVLFARDMQYLARPEVVPRLLSISGTFARKVIGLPLVPGEVLTPEDEELAKAFHTPTLAYLPALYLTGLVYLLAHEPASEVGVKARVKARWAEWNLSQAEQDAWAARGAEVARREWWVKQLPFALSGKTCRDAVAAEIRPDLDHLAAAVTAWFDELDATGTVSAQVVWEMVDAIDPIINLDRRVA